MYPENQMLKNFNKITVTILAFYTIESALLDDATTMRKNVLKQSKKSAMPCLVLNSSFYRLYNDELTVTF